MTPRQFEARYEPSWVELERGLAALDAGRKARKPQGRRVPDRRGAVPPARRASPSSIASAASTWRWRASAPIRRTWSTRLEALTARAHQRIYRRHDFGLGALRDLVLYDVPAAVRALRWHLLVAALVFVLPILAGGRRDLARSALRADRRRRQAGAHVRRHVRPRGRRAPRAAPRATTGRCSASTSCTTSASRSSASPPA